ncbi:putative thioredoxin/glutaredoxin [Methanohalophilus levihalophilus]|nr:putative thioredoxin/glutaredoxin [Methanohalophilus levihalophilus]
MFKEINISGSEGAERARQLGIEEVPTIAIDGEVVLIGRVDKDDIEQEINSFL